MFRPANAGTKAYVPAHRKYRRDTKAGIADGTGLAKGSCLRSFPSNEEENGKISQEVTSTKNLIHLGFFGNLMKSQPSPSSCRKEIAG